MRLALPAVLALAACSTLPESGEGAVYAFNGDTVTIRGGFAFGQTASPTPAMVAQARDVCPGAEYLSASPYEGNDAQFLYLFRC